MVARRSRRGPGERVTATEREPIRNTTVRYRPAGAARRRTSGPGSRAPWRLATVGGGGERGLVAPLVFKTSGTGHTRPVGSIPATSAADPRRASDAYAHRNGSVPRKGPTSASGRPSHHSGVGVIAYVSRPLSR